MLFLFWASASVAYVIAITGSYCFEHLADVEKEVRGIVARLPPLTLKSMPFYAVRLIEHDYENIHLHAAARLTLTVNTCCEAGVACDVLFWLAFLNACSVSAARPARPLFWGAKTPQACFLLLVGCTVFSMTGALFLQQVRLLCSGQTTISRLQNRKNKKLQRGLVALGALHLALGR